MPAAVMPIWRPQFFDNNGDPLASGTIETYESGTSTPLATYSDSDLSVSNGTTITLNSAGFPQVSGSEVAIYLLPQAYRFVLKNSAGTTIRTVDNVYAVQAAASTNLDISDAVAGEALSANDVVYLSDGSGSRTAGRWYRADADTFAYSIHVTLGMATASIASAGDSGTVRIGGVLSGFSGLSAGSTYYVSATAGGVTATAPANARPVGVAISASVLKIDFSPMWIDPVSFHCEGRLTLTTATPITTADVTGAITLYFTPHRGNRLTLFDGTRWKTYTFSEISIAVPSTTATMYDVFVYDNAGTITLELTAWSSDTARATAITLQNGHYVKSGATTRLFVGCIRTTGVSGQTEDSFAKRYVWNYYNRVPRILRRLETTSTWTYTTLTVRQANGAAANQVEVVVGVAEVRMRLSLQAGSRNTNADITRTVGIGEDSTTTYMSTELNTGMHDGGGTIPANEVVNHVVAVANYPAIGRHYYSWNEISAATGTTTWIGTIAPTGGSNTSQAGLTGEIEG